MITSIFQCIIDNNLGNDNNDYNDDESNNRLISNRNMELSISTTNNNTNRNRNRSIEVIIGPMILDMSYDNANSLDITIQSLVNEALDAYCNTYYNNKIIIKGIITNDQNYMYLYKDIFNNVINNSIYKLTILFEFDYTSIIMNKRILTLIFDFLYKSPHQLFYLTMVFFISLLLSLSLSLMLSLLYLRLINIHSIFLILIFIGNKLIFLVFIAKFMLVTIHGIISELNMAFLIKMC